MSAKPTEGVLAHRSRRRDPRQVRPGAADGPSSSALRPRRAGSMRPATEGPWVATPSVALLRNAPPPPQSGSALGEDLGPLPTSDFDPKLRFKESAYRAVKLAGFGGGRESTQPN